MDKVRKEAQIALGEWFAESIKKQTAACYRFWRALGFPANQALGCARMMVEDQVNNFAKRNFYGPSPF